MSKTLEQYLAESAQEHEFRLKLAVEPTDKQLDAMELHLRKYDGYDFTTPKKTIMQKNPRDFRSIDAAEVYMIDFKTKQPASPQHLLAELTEKMGIHERHMIVRNKMEPLHVEDEAEEIDMDDYKVKLTDADYTDAEKVDADNYFGEKHKESFIKEIAKQRAELNTEYKG